MKTFFLLLLTLVIVCLGLRSCDLSGSATNAGHPYVIVGDDFNTLTPGAVVDLE